MAISVNIKSISFFLTCSKSRSKYYLECLLLNDNNFSLSFSIGEFSSIAKACDFVSERLGVNSNEFCFKLSHITCTGCALYVYRKKCKGVK